jgi:large subunit ribosomal protein L24
MLMRKLKKGDPVIVIAGAHKGAISHIVKVDGDRVYLHDVNKVKKAVKGQGFVEKEASIHISNVAYYDEKAKAPTRVGIKIDEKTGKKVRYSKKTGNVLPELSKKA